MASVIGSSVGMFDDVQGRCAFIPSLHRADESKPDGLPTKMLMRGREACRHLPCRAEIIDHVMNAEPRGGESGDVLLRRRGSNHLHDVVSHQHVHFKVAQSPGAMQLLEII